MNTNKDELISNELNRGNLGDSQRDSSDKQGLGPTISRGFTLKKNCSAYDWSMALTLRCVLSHLRGREKILVTL